MMSSAADRLARGLLSLPLIPAGAASGSLAAEAVSGADERAWTICLSRLVEHHLSPLVWQGLVEHDLTAKVPAEVAFTLAQHFERAGVVNALALQALRDVGGAVAARGGALTACKGIVLAPDYYPALGARPTNDIDLWMSPDHVGICAEAMRENGFVRNEPKSGRGADYFENGMGVVFDVHFEMELFSTHRDPLVTLTRPVPGGPWRVFEPHPLLAHLAVHMASHAVKLGPMLVWMIDLWFVLRKIGAEVDPARLRALVPSPAHWIMFLRTLRMLEGLAGQPCTGPLARSAAVVSPYDVDALWRERRRAIWNLPRPKGWARLCACRLGLKDSLGRSYPSLGDLARWPFDRLLDRVALDRSRRTS